MPRTRIKVSLPRFHFLVLGDEVHQFVDARRAAGDILEISGQADRRKVNARAFGVGRRDHALAGGKFERQRRAERHRLAMQQPAGEAAAGFQRVAEVWPRLSSARSPLSAFVARDDAGLAAAAHRDGVFARRTSREP